MAKQAAKKSAPKQVADPIIEEQVQPKEVVVVKEEKTNTWEIKDRMYYLTKNVSPLTYRLQAKHAMHRPLMWFDEEQGYQRELRYATNKKSPFVDEQEGPVTLGHIVFQNGTLFVPREQQALQKLLSLYHPGLNKKYMEQDKAAEAVDDLDFFELELEAMTAAKNMEIDHAEAILRVEIGSGVSKMSSKEIKRDLMMFARNEPKLFLDLANDENVQLRDIAIKASEQKIIKLSQDQRTFTWGSTGRKIMTVPFDENPYSAMAAFFKTDEGVEVYRSIEKKLI